MLIPSERARVRRHGLHNHQSWRPFEVVLPGIEGLIAGRFSVLANLGYQWLSATEHPDLDATTNSKPQHFQTSPSRLE
jgi:hypothetical protein